MEEMTALHMAATLKVGTVKILAKSTEGMACGVIGALALKHVEVAIM